MEWIKFKDKWPEKSERFLFYSVFYDEFILGIRGCGDNDEVLFSDEKFCQVDSRLDYWIPLPDKPTE